MAAVQFTLLIRLPFARGDFVDPPQAEWNATKDRALWKVISKSSKTSDLNWSELADRYQVPQTFLLQQAAWLYERHLDHVRTQMKKVGSSNAPPTVTSGSSHTAVGGIPMRRLGSSQSSRTPSALSIRPRDSPILRGDAGSPALAPSLSRSPSTNTITQSRAQLAQNAIRNQSRRLSRPSGTSPRPPAPIASPPFVNQDEALDIDSPDAEDSSSSSDSSSESDLQGPAHRSQLFKRPPRFQKQRPRELSSYDEDPEEGDDFGRSGDAGLPFAQARNAASTIAGNTKHALQITSIDKQKQPAQSHAQRATHVRNISREQIAKQEVLEASSSLASSASDAPKPPNVGPGPLSPRHRAELAKLSPRRQGTKTSDGTPSMGSSFSDIDDPDISQSALEEALLSNIQHGRMSTLSQLRSRYL